MIVFHANKQTAYQRVEHPEKDTMLKVLQGHVGGYIEELPHLQGWDAPFVAYANEEGMILGLPSNYMAWGVLYHLGFDVLSMPDCFYAGNVVLLGQDESALTATQFNQVDVAVAKYLEGVRPLANLPSTEYDTFPKTKRVKIENKV